MMGDITMVFSRPMPWLILVAFLGGCQHLPLESLPCPCATGWVCCNGANSCVPEGGVCPQPDAGSPQPVVCEIRSEPTVWGATINYLGPVEAAPVQAGQPFHLRYQIAGGTSRGGPSDRIVMRALVDDEWGAGGWEKTVTNADGSTPFDLVLGPEGGSRDLLVRVVPPNVDGVETFITVTATPCALGSNTIISAMRRIRVGEVPQPGEIDGAVSLYTTNLKFESGSARFRVPRNGIDVYPFMTVKVSNRTSAALTVDYQIQVYGKRPASGVDWIIKPPTGVKLEAVSLPSQESNTLGYQFSIPKDGAQWFVPVFRMVESSSRRVLAEAYFPMLITGDP